MSKDLREVVLSLCGILDDRKAEDIIAIDVADKTIIAEWFIVCSGTSMAHVRALADEVDERFPREELTLKRIDGYSAGRWVVMDFGSILVHIFYPEEREYYNIERLWLGAPESYINYSKAGDRA
ncbi:MAG: ribosome silencing factor [Clostridia bacterium]|nr:ribosome silencing factor [Clostridia bacterium]